MCFLKLRSAHETTYRFLTSLFTPSGGDNNYAPHVITPPEAKMWHYNFGTLFHARFLEIQC